MGVNIIAFSTYILLLTRMVPAFLDKNGLWVEPARYLEWLGTCPVLIFLIAEITRSEGHTWVSIKNDWALIIFGFIASITREPLSEWFGTLSMCSFFVVVANLWTMYTAAIRGDTECTLDPTSLKTLRLITLTCWTGYLVKGKAVSYATGEALYCLSDIGAKVFLTLVLVNFTVEQTQNEKVDAISEIAYELEEQMSNTEQLLAKMMPPNVLEQLKSGEGTSAEEYESVTVFFSDITNFTVLSSRTSTKAMLDSLNKLWLEYDKIAKRWGIYKVETIGDAYLGIAGCPERAADHAERAVNFAIDIMDMIKGFRTVTNEQIAIRIGLNSGPVTAGVLGDLNPHWCIVGDTVNTASRMESTSKPMMIHISDSTYQLSKNRFKFSEPEDLEIKGKGKMRTYWVNGRL
ncbi:Guanylate cyclase 2G [Quaeritorhiza haematococci]|nr:Guanylate cyclase 2G [Quaeritorhiza haematococci]